MSPENIRDTWGTPRALFDQLCRDYGYTVDACASAINALLPRYWTREQDGLVRPCAGEVVWCNPPYSDITPWVARAYEARAP